MFALHHAKLVAAAQNGDGRAFDDLVAAYLPLLYNIVGRAVAGRADVDDIVQEILLRVVRDLPALRDPNSFRPWLVAIAIRQISTHRYRRRDDAQARSFEADEIADAAAGFEDLSVLRLHLSEQRRQTVDASRWLDADHRLLLSLWWQECAGLLSRVELADAAGLTVAHAGVRLQRMREQLDLSRAIVAALAAQPRCAPLDAALAGWDGQRSSVWRKRIGRHVRGCPVCGQASAGQIPLERLLLSFAALPIPVGLAAALATKGLIPAAAGTVHATLIGKLAQAMTAHPLASLVTGAVLVAGPAVTYTSWPEAPHRPPVIVAAPPPSRPAPSRSAPPWPSARPSPYRSAPAPGTLPIGVWSLAAADQPGQFLSYAVTGYAALTPVSAASTDAARQRATFTVVRGLADRRCITFRTSDGRYLRHYELRLRVNANDGTALFREDATFCPHPGSVAGSVTLQSHNYPALVLRHRDGGLWIDVSDGSTAFGGESSFVRREPWR